MRSSDGGKTWVASGPPDTLTIMGAEFTTEEIAWCVSPTHLWATTDGGTTWHRRGALKQWAGFYQAALHRLKFFGTETGYLSGSQSYSSDVVFQCTTDGGWTWKTSDLTANVRFESAGPIRFTGDSICTFIFSYYDERVNHYMGGLVLSWNRLQDAIVTGEDWFIFDNQQGWIGPYRDGFALGKERYWLLTSMTGTIRKTTDGGATWRVDSLVVPITQIFGDRFGLRFALGGGRLFRSSELVTEVAKPDGKPSTYVLEQNYPNPFNPSTTIRYAVPVRSHVILTVFNALGQQVADLQDREVDPGYHEVQFDARVLSSGVYFYRLKAGVFSETKRLLLVR
jgi:hypothetical protein